MRKQTPEQIAATILARVDKSSADHLLASLAWELALLHQANQALEARLAAVELFQASYDRVLPALGVAPRLAQSVFIDARFALTADAGFGPLAFDDNGRPYRATGPEPTFHVEALVDRSTPARLIVNYSNPSAESAEGVRAIADGVELNCETQALEGAFELHTVLPERQCAGSTIIRFMCPSQTDVAGRLNFHWLKVERAAQSAATSSGARTRMSVAADRSTRTRQGAQTA